MEIIKRYIREIRRTKTGIFEGFSCGFTPGIIDFRRYYYNEKSKEEGGIPYPHDHLGDGDVPFHTHGGVRVR